MGDSTNRWLGQPLNQPDDEGCHACHYWHVIGTEGCWDCAAHSKWEPMTAEDKKPRCHACHRTPEQLEEYISSAAEAGCSPVEYVILEEGTYDPETNRFWCTSCYIKVGQPCGLVP